MTWGRNGKNDLSGGVGLFGSGSGQKDENWPLHVE